MAQSHFSYIQDGQTSYKKGIDFQREQFKLAKHNNNYDSMCDAIENIKSEIKRKVLGKGNKNIVDEIENIVVWYRTKEQIYTKRTPDGTQIVFPVDMIFKVNQELTRAYELLIGELDLLDLL